MDLTTSLLNCLCGGCEQDNPQPNHNQIHNNHGSYNLITEKPPPIEPPPTPSHLAAQATEILTILLHAPSPGPDADLTPLVATKVSTTDWTSYLAERVLHGIEEALKAGDHASWGEALSEAYAHARELARAELRELWDYAREHPVEVAAEVLLTVLAMGVLARLLPGLVRVLGFARLGPVEGEYLICLLACSFAAWWQRLYGGYVPKGSLWSFLQRMGMTWE
ncbi:hypothetical protein B0I37DRAFT_243437 [Chaetomium sp. MPI-CAGE-AT-0009]|nr:hypothetical protein B0I37DRAFT_243437 [Chaetomium sp. MPI-CAGE-AT-0009]